MKRKVHMKYAKYRLTKQMYGYDCGAAAIVNLMKLSGQKIPYKTSYHKLFKALGIKENKGVYLKELHSFLTKRQIPKCKFKIREKNLTYNQVQKMLDRGYLAILAYGRGPLVPGHICVVAGHNRCGLEIVNWDHKGTIQTIGFDKFKYNVLDFNEAFYYFFERK